MGTRAVTQHTTKGHRERVVRRVASTTISHEDGGDDTVRDRHVSLSARARSAAERDVTERTRCVTRTTLEDGEVGSRIVEDDGTREVGECAGQNYGAHGVNPRGAGQGMRIEDDRTRTGDRILQAHQAIGTDQGQRGALRNIDSRRCVNEVGRVEVSTGQRGRDLRGIEL